MNKGRLEAFSDGVIAIIITIMVLELTPPHKEDIAALIPLVPTLFGYLLSFVFIGIYWINHHHLLQASKQVNGLVLWANLHMLFWLSLIPFATAWMGDSAFATWPVALYGALLLCISTAYTLLARALITLHGRDSVLATAIGIDIKGRISLAIYLLAIPLAFVNRFISCALFVLVAILWFIPDQRIEKLLAADQRTPSVTE